MQEHGPGAWGIPWWAHRRNVRGKRINGHETSGMAHVTYCRQRQTSSRHTGEPIGVDLVKIELAHGAAGALVRAPNVQLDDGGRLEAPARADRSGETASAVLMDANRALGLGAPNQGIKYSDEQTSFSNPCTGAK